MLPALHQDILRLRKNFLGTCGTKAFDIGKPPVAWGGRFHPPEEGPMPKDEWGVKRICPHCGVRFYDLMHDPMTCPSCAMVFTKESLVQVKLRGTPEKAKPEAKSDELEIADVEDVDVLDAGEDDAQADDELLETDEDDNVSLDDIADMPGGEDE
jgi:uncharacterized protein (TIGR02300 family)